MSKQTELDEFLKTNQFQTEVQEELMTVIDEEPYCFPNVDAANSDIEVIEEYLYDNDTQENDEQYELNIEEPMEKEITNSSISRKEKDLVEIIEQIEQRNKTIFEGSSFIQPKASRNSNSQQIVGRIDSFKVETPGPKLILGLRSDGDSSNTVEVLFNEEYPCDTCQATFTSQAQLIHHVSLIHLKKPKIEFKCLVIKQSVKCKICRKELKNKKSLSVHMRTHDPTRKFPCMFAGCDKGFNMKVS